MLSDKIERYKTTGKFPTVTPAKYKDEYPYLREVDSLALANKQMDLQEAFRNRFSKSRKKNNGFPKYKSAKHNRKSYTTNNQKSEIYKEAVKMSSEPYNKSLKLLTEHRDSLQRIAEALIEKETFSASRNIGSFYPYF